MPDVVPEQSVIKTPEAVTPKPAEPKPADKPLGAPEQAIIQKIKQDSNPDDALRDIAEAKPTNTAQTPDMPKRPGILERASQLLNHNVLQSVPIHNEDLGYDSVAGTYGFTLVKAADGELVFTSSGIWNKVDRVGDRLIRKTDEHVIKRPTEMLKRHPRRFFQQVTTEAKRARGETEEIVENADRLGLSEYYGIHPQGVELKKPELLTKGINLWDIYTVNNPALSEIDRLSALSTAAGYIRQVHDTHGAIGEVLTNDIIFQKKEGTMVSEPVLNLPDIVYSSQKYSSEQLKNATEPRAVDLMDFLMSVGASEVRKTGDWEKVKQAMNAIISGYGESKVIPAVASLARRGRLTLDGRITGQHNTVRLSMDKQEENIALQMRQLVIAECGNKL